MSWTKLSISHEPFKISFDIMAFLESAGNFLSIEHYLSSVAPIQTKLEHFELFVILSSNKSSYLENKNRCGIETLHAHVMLLDLYCLEE